MLLTSAVKLSLATSAGLIATYSAKSKAKMTVPRSERLRITQEVYKQWQEIYGDREDAEAESANWDMLNKAMAEAEEKYKDRPANS